MVLDSLFRSHFVFIDMNICTGLGNLDLDEGDGDIDDDDGDKDHRSETADILRDLCENPETPEDQCP